ncbi:hypothetical protein Ct61P_15143 [Colletotrichum tofieldiae]|nr:hypothetical protein Ct61P_15143 [Colletotrichum tofieldiae]
MPTSVFIVEASAEIMRKSGPRLARNLASLVATENQPQGVTVIMPLNHNQQHWTVALVNMADRQPTISLFNSLPASLELLCATEAEVCLQLAALVEPETANPDRNAKPRAMSPFSSWTLQPRSSLIQSTSFDCGVAVIIHTLYALTNVALPTATDWLLWRRVICVFLEARDAYDGSLGDAKAESTSSAAAGKGTLDALRQEHANMLELGMQPTVTLTIPENVAHTVGQRSNNTGQDVAEAKDLCQGLENGSGT